jgi:S-(hydroxymethyl)glutathione dehydrogenase/alcohol dehydrogenase
MKAAVLYEVNKPLVVEEIDIDEPQQGEVLVKTVAAGVCHSDLHFMEGTWPYPLPVVMGHEGAGIIEQVGEGVTAVQPGDHVILSFIPWCGACRYCAEGRPFLCTQGGSRTIHLHKGGQNIFAFLSVSSFAEHMVVPQNGVVKIREDAPLEKVALVGCGVTTGVGAVVNTAKVQAGSSVVVVGTGGVGLNVIQGAVLAGAAQIVAVDILDNKLEMAKQFGATHTVNASAGDPVAAVRELTGGGPDYAFEVIGSTETVAQAWNMVGAGGKVIVVGMVPFGQKVCIDGNALMREKSLLGCLYGSTRPLVDMPRIVELYMAGRLKIDELVSRTYPLERINEAFAALKNGEVARSIIKF